VDCNHWTKKVGFIRWIPLPSVFLFPVLLLTAVEPVGAVDKTEHVFGSVLSKQLWEKAAKRFAFFHSCGSFHRLPLPSVFLLFPSSFRHEAVSTDPA